MQTNYCQLVVCFCVALSVVAFFITLCSPVGEFSFLKRFQQHASLRLNNYRSSHSTDRLPMCSFPAFRDHLRSTGSMHLEGGGTWTRRQRHDGSRTLSAFRPSICRLEHGAWLPRSYLFQCIRRQNLTCIAILGDSNAWRLYFIARQSLSVSGRGRLNHGIHVPDRLCRLHLSAYNEQLTPNFFSVRLPTTTAPGHETTSYEAGTSSSLVVQYLPNTGDYQEFGSKINSTNDGCWNCTNRTTVDTYQEFIFRHYFNAGATPDLVIYQSSSWEQSSLSDYASNVDKFVDLLRRNPLPSRTRLLVVSKPDECVQLKPSWWKERTYEGGKMTRTQWIDAANNILHNRLVPLFLSDETDPKQLPLLLFPDIAQSMRPVIDELAIDGVHTQSHWYQTLWSFIIQSLCDTEL